MTLVGMNDSQGFLTEMHSSEIHLLMRINLLLSIPLVVGATSTNLRKTNRKSQNPTSAVSEGTLPSLLLVNPPLYSLPVPNDQEFLEGYISISFSHPSPQIEDVGYRDEVQVQLRISIGCPTYIRTSIEFANLSYSRLSGDSYEADKPLFQNRNFSRLVMTIQFCTFPYLPDEIIRNDLVFIIECY